MINYKEFKPCEALSKYVNCFWVIKNDPFDGTSIPEERIIPDGSLEIIFHLGKRMVRKNFDGKLIKEGEDILIGQVTRPYFICPTGNVHMIGVRFFPYTAHFFFDLPIAKLNDNSVDLEALWGPEFHGLKSRIKDAGDTKKAIEVIEAFGISFRAYDNRVDLAGDAANFTQTTAPFVDDVFHKVYVLKEALSTVRLLEDYDPSKSMEVYHIIVQPGAALQFESIIRRIKEAAKQDGPTRFSLYKLISGGEQPGYMLMAPRSNFSYFNNSLAFTSLGDLIQQNFEGKEATVLMDKLYQSVKSIKGETWGYRPDLSYFPSD